MTKFGRAVTTSGLTPLLVFGALPASAGDRSSAGSSSSERIWRPSPNRWARAHRKRKSFIAVRLSFSLCGALNRSARPSKRNRCKK